MARNGRLIEPFSNMERIDRDDRTVSVDRDVSSILDLLQQYPDGRSTMASSHRMRGIRDRDAHHDIAASSWA
jgi:outer membrane protein assembly factor BamD (BamD/ComL family)